MIELLGSQTKGIVLVGFTDLKFGSFQVGAHEVGSLELGEVEDGLRAGNATSQSSLSAPGARTPRIRVCTKPQD